MSKEELERLQGDLLVIAANVRAIATRVDQMIQRTGRDG